MIRPKPFLIFCGLLLGALALTMRVTAQADTTPWLPPINVSRSGAATQPINAVTPDGVQHVVWWDETVGALYAHNTASLTATTWSPPTVIGEIFGDRQIDLQTKQVIAQTAPRDWRLAATTTGHVSVFWINDKKSFLTGQVQGQTFGKIEELATMASALEVEPDAAGGLQLIYVDNTDSVTRPAGIYYRHQTEAGWSQPTLIYASPYFRALKPQNIYISIAGDGDKAALASWDDPQLGRSVFARSADGGLTWSAPQVVGATTSNTAGRAQHAYQIAVPAQRGSFLQLWQNPTTGGCGFVQSQSTDGGQSWNAPQKVLSGYQRCLEKLSFSPGDKGEVWLTGRLPVQDANTRINAVTLASWTDGRWSTPIEMSLNFYDQATSRTVNLSCLNVAFNGPAAGIAGCDAQNDIWVARNAVPLNEIGSSTHSAWDDKQQLSDGMGGVAVEGVPALAVDSAGKFYALWSQSPTDTQANSLLYAAVYDSNRWGRTVAVLRSPERPGDIPSAAIKPALAIDPQDKIHLVWNNGTNGQVLYSWAYAHDFASSAGWAEPIGLPTPTGLIGWPDIVADPHGQRLYVAYAVPYNEQRGIYLTRSNDGGSTWLTPTLVFDGASASHQVPSVDKVRLAFDAAADVLHAVWVRPNLPGALGPQAIYYARSVDGGQTWSEPFKVVEGAVDWPRVAVPGAGQVYIAWNQESATAAVVSTVPYSAWGMFSPEMGSRWGTASTISGFEKVSGPLSLTSDGSGQLHVTAVSQVGGQESALYHAQWNGQGWGEREIIGLGQEATAGNTVVAALAPQVGRLQAVLRLLTWNQAGDGQFEAFGTGRSVTPVALTPLPTFTPQPTPTLKPTSTPEPTATPRPQIKNSDQQTGSSGPNGLGLGALLAAVVVVLVFAMTIWRQRR